MKKIILPFACLLMTGCSSIDKQTIASHSTADSNLVQENYQNIVFANNYTVDKPVHDTYETFELIRKKALSVDESFACFDKAAEKYFPQLENRETYYNLNAFANGKALERDEIDTKSELNDFEYFHDVLTGKDARIIFMMLISPQGTVQMHANGGLYTLIRDRSFHLDYPDENNVGLYFATDENEITDRVHLSLDSTIPDYSAAMLDKTVSMRDAVPLVYSYLADAETGVENPELKPDITEIWRVDMGEGISGFHFWLTNTYHGIRIDTMPMKSGMMAQYDDRFLQRPYSLYPGSAFMIRSDELDMIMAFHSSRTYDIANVQTHTPSISYEDALQRLSDTISGNTVLELSYTEFVYTPYLDTNDSEPEHLTVDAAWKFTGHNYTDDYDYVFYVHADNGETEYYKYW